MYRFHEIMGIKKIMNFNFVKLLFLSQRKYG